MRIAVPVTGEDVCAALDACGAIRFYEDDHGRVVSRTEQRPERAGFAAVLALLSRGGADVLLCAAPSAEERSALAAEGLLLAEGAAGDADAAVRAYLGRAVFCDPNNTCNYCGFKDECEGKK